MPAAVTPRALAHVIEEHFGVGATSFSSGVTGLPIPTQAVVYYAAAPGRPSRGVRLGYGEGPEWAQDEAACSDAGMATPSVTCVSREDVRLGWEEGQGTAQVISARANGVVVAELDGVPLPADPMRGGLSDDLTKLIALAKDPRADATTAAGQLSTTTPWTEDPGCESAPQAALATPVPPSGEPAEPATPQAFVALIAERTRGTCGFGSSDADDPAISGTLFLAAGDTERVTAMVSAQPVSCDGMDACEKRGQLTIAWQLDVPEEYPATVRVSRPVPGGHVVITHTSMHANPQTRSFPVPLDTLLSLGSDDRFGFTVDPALNRAGAASSLCWRFVAPTGG